MSNITTAQKEATKRYQAKLKSLSLRIQPVEYERFSEEADRRNMSLRSFVLTAVNEKITREAGPAAVPVNQETVAAIREVEAMEATGTGQHFGGSSADFTAMLLNED